MQIEKEIGIDVPAMGDYEGGFFPLTKIFNTILAFLEKIFAAIFA